MLLLFFCVKYLLEYDTISLAMIYLAIYLKKLFVEV